MMKMARGAGWAEDDRVAAIWEAVRLAAADGLIQWRSGRISSWHQIRLLFQF
jgi:hypothetical protein